MASEITHNFTHTQPHFSSGRPTDFSRGYRSDLQSSSSLRARSTGFQLEERARERFSVVQDYD